MTTCLIEDALKLGLVETRNKDDGRGPMYEVRFLKPVDLVRRLVNAARALECAP